MAHSRALGQVKPLCERGEWYIPEDAEIRGDKWSRARPLTSPAISDTVHIILKILLTSQAISRYAGSHHGICRTAPEKNSVTA